MIKKTLITLMLIASFFVSNSFSQTTFDFDVRSGIQLNLNENTSTQSQFVKEVYFNVNSKLSDRFDAEASINFDGTNLGLYTANLKYTLPANTSNLSFKLGKFENDYYLLGEKLWNNNFVSYLNSTSYVNKTGTGLEIKASSKFADLSVSTLGTVNHDTINFKSNKILAVLTTRPFSSLTIGGFFYTVGNVNDSLNFTDESTQYVGGVVNFNKQFKKTFLNVGSEIVYDLKDSSSISSETWVELSHKNVFKGVVSLVGNLKYVILNNGLKNHNKTIGIGVICHPIKVVNIGLFYHNVEQDLQSTYYTISLLTQVRF